MGNIMGISWEYHVEAKLSKQECHGMFFPFFTIIQGRFNHQCGYIMDYGYLFMCILYNYTHPPVHSDIAMENGRPLLKA